MNFKLIACFRFISPVSAHFPTRALQDAVLYFKVRFGKCTLTSKIPTTKVFMFTAAISNIKIREAIISGKSD